MEVNHFSRTICKNPRCLPEQLLIESVSRNSISAPHFLTEREAPSSIPSVCSDYEQEKKQCPIVFSFLFLAAVLDISGMYDNIHLAI